MKCLGLLGADAVDATSVYCRLLTGEMRHRFGHGADVRLVMPCQTKPNVPASESTVASRRRQGKEKRIFDDRYQRISGIDGRLIERRNHGESMWREQNSITGFPTNEGLKDGTPLRNDFCAPQGGQFIRQLPPCSLRLSQRFDTHLGDKGA